jgi:predicted DNA-binding ribbon-helix-helix protein
VTVPVKLPDFVWGRLATIAEHRQVSIADLIADGIWHTLDSDPNRLAELQMALKKKTPNQEESKAA